jgi:hypothetical protein
LARCERYDCNLAVFGSLIPDRLRIICLLFPVSLQRQ